LTAPEGTQLLNISTDAVKSRLRRARAMMRERLLTDGYLPSATGLHGIRISWEPVRLEEDIRTKQRKAVMSKITAFLGSALFFVVAPAMVAGLVPWVITHWEFEAPFLAAEPTRWVGIAFIVVGVPGLLDSFARFALQGLGTPAPIAPTRILVVTGLYRYVRNPMYVSVVALILGQAFLLGDWGLLLYGALVFLPFHIFVVLYEEPTLKQTYEAQYENYRANVPRWLPRLTPWRAV
jgi:protein-S-isoprenylcysteine O-methyltransferase Ste14